VCYVTGEGEDVWAIENLVIGGRSSSCDAEMLVEDFDPLNLNNWLFISGGSVGAQCTDSRSQSGTGDLLRSVGKAPIKSWHFVRSPL